GRYIAGGTIYRDLYLWEVMTGEEVLRLTANEQERADYFDAAIKAVGFSHDNEKVMAVSYNGIYRLWEIATGELLDEVAFEDAPIYGVAFSPDGTHLAYVDTSGELKITELTLETEE